MSIGTRPDCVDEEKIDLISSYTDRYEVWIEYGLQSIRNDTLESIGRGHTFEDFLRAAYLSKSRKINVCAHVILGLPGETAADAAKTAAALSDVGVDGVKIHLLHVLKGSLLEKWYGEGRVTIMEQPEYVSAVCAFLENLSADIVIQRLTGEGDRENHVAPAWAMDKTGTIRMIEDELVRRGTRQGISYQLQVKS